jgi:hypothetical protein
MAEPKTVEGQNANVAKYGVAPSVTPFLNSRKIKESLTLL